MFKKIQSLFTREEPKSQKRGGWADAEQPALTPIATASIADKSNSNVQDAQGLERTRLVRELWQAFALLENEPFLVKPSIPILFFGDSDLYFKSKLKVITLGLNPSKSEFPAHDRFSRFRRAPKINTHVFDEAFVDAYLQALNGYFRRPPNDPYDRWFNSFEPLLQGLDCSFYGRKPHTALHTDLCSPFATDPTWGKVPQAAQERLLRSGGQLWHSLVEWLSPDVIVASVARDYLGRISFPRRSGWKVVHTIERKNPYKVELIDLALPNGKSALLVFGKAAQRPFGKVLARDKLMIGAAIKAYMRDEA